MSRTPNDADFALGSPENPRGSPATSQKSTPGGKRKRVFGTTRDSLVTAGQRYGRDKTGKMFGTYEGKALRFFINSWSLFFTSFFIVMAKGWARVNFQESAYNDPFGSTIAAGLVTAFAISLSHMFLTSFTFYTTIFEAVIMVGFGRNWRQNATSAAIACTFYLIALAAGAYAGAGVVYGLQATNSVTFTGVPQFATFGSVWEAFFIEFIGSSIMIWASLHVYHNYSTFKLKRTFGGAFFLGLLQAGLMYASFRKTGGCFNELEYLALASWSGHWQDDKWVYFVAPLAANVFYLIWFGVFRDTKLDTKEE